MCSKSEVTQRGTHTNTHAWGRGCVPGANWQQQSYLWAGLGWGQGQNQEVWHQDCTVPPNRPCKCKKWHTQEHNSCCGLLLTPWNCPLPSLPSPYHVNTCEMCGAVEYFGDTGLLWNMSLSGDRNWQIFFRKQKDMGGEERFLLLHHVISCCIEVICAHTICADVQVRTAKRNVRCKNTHTSHLTQVFSHEAPHSFTGLWLFQL